MVIRGPLAAGLIALAGTPDESTGVETQLAGIVRLAARRVTPVSYASVTSLGDEDCVTVALSDELIRAVDEARDADDAGPRRGAPVSGAPVTVPDIVATVLWPRFNEQAARMGLNASVSVPLYAGRCVPIAVLSLYGRDRAAMAPLVAGIYRLHGYAGARAAAAGNPVLRDEGGRELIAGCAEALAVRATILLATDLIRSGTGCESEDAYLSLCDRAARCRTDLARAAEMVIAAAI